MKGCPIKLWLLVTTFYLNPMFEIPILWGFWLINIVMIGCHFIILFMLDTLESKHLFRQLWANSTQSIVKNLKTIFINSKNSLSKVQNTLRKMRYQVLKWSFQLKKCVFYYEFQPQKYILLNLEVWFFWQKMGFYMWKVHFSIQSVRFFYLKTALMDLERVIFY